YELLVELCEECGVTLDMEAAFRGDPNERYWPPWYSQLDMRVPFFEWYFAPIRERKYKKFTLGDIWEIIHSKKYDIPKK
ncbi:MAG: hypothetical protein ACTSUD_14040, partial [Alphaproteobacteria bacterium]